MIRKLYKDHLGQALVEMALVLPILLMLMFGIIEFGRVYASYLMVNHASREGARAASVGMDDTEVIDVIQNRTLSLAMDSTKLNIDINPLSDYRERGNSVSVTVQYPVAIYAPIISNITGNPIIVKGKTIMRIE